MNPTTPSASPPASRLEKRERVTLWMRLTLLAAAGAWGAVNGGAMIAFLIILLAFVGAHLTHGFRTRPRPAGTKLQKGTLAEVQQRLAEAEAQMEAQGQELCAVRRLLEEEKVLCGRFSMAVDAIGVSLWEMDFQRRQFTWDYNRAKAYGLDDVHIDDLAEPLVKLIYPQDLPHLRQVIAQAAAGVPDASLQRFRILLSDGTTAHMQSRIRIIRDASGAPVGIMGATADVTSEVETAQLLQRQTQQLRETEQRLERASLLSSEGHWEWDFVAKIAWYSTSYHSLLGYQSGELPTDLRLSLRKVQHPDDIEWQFEKYLRHIRQDEPYDFEARLRLGSGEYRWFRVRGTAERDAQGQPVAMAGSLQDIHQQKLIEDALKLAQSRFERAITGTQDGLWELEVDGHAWCSPRVLELLGYPPDALASDTNFIREFLHPDDTQAVAAATQLHFQQGIPYDVEIRLCTRNGQYRWYRARALAERDSQGQPLRLSGSLQDVTEARAARDELLRATEAAEAASRAKSSFLANVSHEIRTPMNGIIGMTGLLLDTRLDRTQRDYADTIRSSADLLLKVINDILDFSKIEADKMIIESLELEPRAILEDIAAMMAFQAADKNLEIIVNVDSSAPQRVMGDPQRLRQCLINLLGNAIKFTADGEIVLDMYVVGRRGGEALLHFEVRDTGVGIAQDALETLFQPFVQADSSTTRHYGGTGLGLSIVQRLVRMMGGEVGVTSEVGMGSAFWFVLPMQIAVDEPAPLDLTRLGRRVLIVDDNATSGNALADQLKYAGYEVSLAASGAAALSFMHRAAQGNYPCQIVVTDCELPDMTGVTLGERIKADANLSQVRIVMLAPLNRHADLRPLAALGFAGSLTRPVRLRDLLACLDQAMSRDRHDWHLQSQSSMANIMQQPADQAPQYAGKVLLTEDNLVNQKVAARFLERLGCSVRIANNGAEAVQAWQEERFALILMDLQMPIMDGLSATRRIRELQGSDPLTPIVALTANAMAGQFETCMDVGMNGFLTKPLEVASLRETLDRFGLGVAQDNSSLGTHAQDVVSPASMAAAVDLARLREITDDDVEFAAQLAQTFITSGAEVLEELKRARARLQRVQLARAAHKFKGASANIHAEALRVLSDLLESRAAEAQEHVIDALVNGIEREYQRVVEFFNQQAALATTSAEVLSVQGARR